MSKITVLVNKKDYNSTIEELKYEFLRNVLLQIDLPIDDCYPLNYKDQTVEQKILAKDLLQKFNLNLIQLSKEEYNIFLDKELIAYWKKPYCVLKQDFNTIDPTKKYYYEVHLNCYSVFDECSDSR